MNGWALRDVTRLHHQRAYRDPALGGGGERQHRRAIVLAAGPGERLLRLTERLNGSPLPKQFCSFGTDETLLQATLRRLGKHVPAGDTQVVIDRRHRARAIAQLGKAPEVDVLAQPNDCGTAVGTLVPLIDILIADPDAVVAIAPADHAILDAAAFDEALTSAFVAAEEHRSIVVMGAEPDGCASDDGWLLPFAPLRPGLRCPVQPVARYVQHDPEATTSLLNGGAVHSTSLVVAHGAAMLELFEAFTPRLLRLFLYGAAMPPAEGSAFLELAYDGLGSLDLAGDLLTLAHGLRMVVLPRSAGWSDLGSETRLLAWLAKRRSAEMMPWPLARGEGRGYRRIHESGTEASLGK